MQAQFFRLVEVADNVYFLKFSMLPLRDSCAVKVEPFLKSNALHPHWTVISFVFIHPITHKAHSALWSVWCFLLGPTSSLSFLMLLTHFLSAFSCFILFSVFLGFSCSLFVLHFLCLTVLSSPPEAHHLVTIEVCGQLCCPPLSVVIIDIIFGTSSAVNHSCMQKCFVLKAWQGTGLELWDFLLLFDTYIRILVWGWVALLQANGAFIQLILTSFKCMFRCTRTNFEWAWWCFTAAWARPRKVHSGWFQPFGTDGM